MAIPKGSEYIVIPVKPEWSNFAVETNYTDVVLKGYDGRTECAISGEPEIVWLTCWEQYSDDTCHHEIFLEAFGDYHGKFLIIKRTRYDSL
jgi:hypothetical protein